jgi:SAM-dependent methyltransferase
MTRTTALRKRAVKAVRRRANTGDAVECSCCGSTFRQFEPLKLPNRRCWTCGSLERHRGIALWLNENPGMLTADSSVLHVAPERALRDRIETSVGEYVSGDLERKYGPERIDVTQLAQTDESLDAVICSHVLEHVPEDRKALGEIRRVLKPGGWAILNTPIVGDTTDEDPSVTDPAERERRFRQHDHVRLYGWDFLDRVRDAGLRVDLWTPDDQRTIERFRLAYDGKVAPLILGRRDA